jgi:DNA-binding IscR family transcriptional regulator
MRLTQKAQYAVLLTIYLQRTGQTRLLDAAIALNLSVAFLEQVARKLKIAGILEVKRGPGGGYALASGTSPRVIDVLNAVGAVDLLSAEDVATNAARGIEGATLNNIVGIASAGLSATLNRTIAELSVGVSSTTETLSETRAN